MTSANPVTISGDMLSHGVEDSIAFNPLAFLFLRFSLTFFRVRTDF